MSLLMVLRIQVFLIPSSANHSLTIIIYYCSCSKLAFSKVHQLCIFSCFSINILQHITSMIIIIMGVNVSFKLIHKEIKENS